MVGNVVGLVIKVGFWLGLDVVGGFFVIGVGIAVMTDVDNI
jgi:hypothetical protein